MDKKMKEALGVIESEPKEEVKTSAKKDAENTIAEIAGTDNKEIQFNLNEIFSGVVEKYEALGMSDDMSAKDILNTELDLYNCNKRVPGYDIIQYLINKVPTAGFTSKPTYPELRKWLATNLDIKEQQVDFNINILINSCDFSKAKFIPVFAKLESTFITAQFFMEQFIDYLFA